LLVIACNTASAVALPALRAITSAPLVGVLEPGVRAAFERTRNGRVGVIATEATVRSGAYRQALEKRSASTAVFEQPCPLFVPLVEEGWTSGDVPRLAARRYLQPLLDARIDTLILGCTHYPLLRVVIAEVVGANVGLVDSGEETALETAARLAEEDLVHPRIDGGGCRVYVSDRPQRFGEIGEAFLREALGKVELVDQSDLPWYAR
jgi:glutamate racemase